MYDIDQLLNGGSTDSAITDLSNQIAQIMAWIIIPSVILTIVVIIFLVIFAVRKRKVENAILEIRDILLDMQKSQTIKSNPQPATNSQTQNVDQASED